MSNIKLNDLSLRDVSLDKLPRLKELRERHFASRPEICVELPRLMTRYMKTIDDPGTHTETIVSQGVYPDNNFGNYQEADLRIEKTGEIYYTITVYNDGPSPAINLVVEDELPENLEWEIVWAETTGFDTIAIDVDGVLTGNIGSLAVDASATVTVKAEIDGDYAGSPLPNTAITYSIIPDLNPDNNSDDADIGPTP